MNSTDYTHPAFAFFGSSRLSVIVLDQLFEQGLVPKFVVTTPDKPIGRKQIITPNVTKQWATSKNILVYDPAKLDHDFAKQIRDVSEKAGTQVYLVASYGKIIPAEIIDIPKKQNPQHSPLSTSSISWTFTTTDSDA
jgi:methionyl-tRNA formyltransferase